MYIYISSILLIGATRTPEAAELLYARQKVITVAKAYRLQAIDLVHIDFKGTLKPGTSFIVLLKAEDNA